MHPDSSGPLALPGQGIFYWPFLEVAGPGLRMEHRPRVVTAIAPKSLKIHKIRNKGTILGCIYYENHNFCHNGHDRRFIFGPSTVRGQINGKSRGRKRKIGQGVRCPRESTGGSGEIILIKRRTGIPARSTLLGCLMVAIAANFLS